MARSKCFNCYLRKRATLCEHCAAIGEIESQVEADRGIRRALAMRDCQTASAKVCNTGLERIVRFLRMYRLRNKRI